MSSSDNALSNALPGTTITGDEAPVENSSQQPNENAPAQRLSKNAIKRQLKQERIDKHKQERKAELERKRAEEAKQKAEEAAKKAEQQQQQQGNKQSSADQDNDDDYEDVDEEEALNKKGGPKWLKTTVENTLNMSITMKPIAIFRSCFSRKNGTPRQGAIAPNSKGYLKLIPENCFGKLSSHHSLINLSDFSHVWLIYYMHDNRKNFSQTKPKARPPRLNGGAVGLFATRSPHVCFFWRVICCFYF